MESYERRSWEIPSRFDPADPNRQPWVGLPASGRRCLPCARPIRQPNPISAKHPDLRRRLMRFLRGAAKQGSMTLHAPGGCSWHTWWIALSTPSPGRTLSLPCACTRLRCARLDCDRARKRLRLRPPVFPAEFRWITAFPRVYCHEQKISKTAAHALFRSFCFTSSGRAVCGRDAEPVPAAPLHGGARTPILRSPAACIRR